MADNDAFLRKLAARIGLPADATTNTDLERALASRLGFDRRTDEWAIGWLEGPRACEASPTRCGWFRSRASGWKGQR
jgi:hypothetical protein